MAILVFTWEFKQTPYVLDLDMVISVDYLRKAAEIAKMSSLMEEGHKVTPES